MKEFLHEVLNSNRSDRDLAGILGLSQPKVTRTRRKLERTECEIGVSGARAKSSI